MPQYPTFMDPIEFLKTIYLGDRGLKNILIDGWNNRVVLQIDLISRVRDASGYWNFYSDEDIADGFLVFTGVESIRVDPPGLIPNDFIDVIGAERLEGKAQERFCVRFSTPASVTRPDGVTVLDGVTEIVAKGVHLEDPARPGLQIIE